MLARPLRVLSHVRPVMRDDSSYSRDQHVNLRQFAPRLDDVTRCHAQATGRGRERSRARGCRAGKHKQTVLERSVRSADQSTISTASVRSTRPLPAARQRHIGLPLPQLKFASFNADRCGIKSTRRATCSPFTASTSHPHSSVDRHL